MPRAIHAHPITETAFAPYGGLISAGLQLPATTRNPGAVKSLEVVKPTDLYARAPSGHPGRSVIHVEVVNPKATQAGAGDAPMIVLDRMERHPFTSQAFIPMGSGVAYLAVVAEGLPGGEAPDLETVRVWVVGEGQGVCYQAGVWHASMSVVGKEPITFAVVQHMNGVTDEDVEFFHMAGEKSVEMYF